MQNGQNEAGQRGAVPPFCIRTSATEEAAMMRTATRFEKALIV
jgi:hypothetical protein